MLNPKCIAGRYKFIQQLGKGGMGEVHLAFDEVLSRNVAVKTLHPSNAIDKATQIRFKREARCLAQLSHPNIMRVFDFGITDEGQVYLVLEYIEMGTLADILEMDLQIQHEKAIEIARSIATALSVIHPLNLIHRDIKPENIFCSEERTVLGDFGLVRSLSTTRLTETGCLVGSLLFLSPEQVTCEKVDARTDIFQLGAVLYRALSGHFIYDYNSPRGVVLVQAIENDIKPLEDICPEIDSRWFSIVGKCLQEDPECRYQSAEEFLRALRCFDVAVDDGYAHEEEPIEKIANTCAVESIPKETSKRKSMVSQVICLLLFFVLLAGLSPSNKKNDEEDKVLSSRSQSDTSKLACTKKASINKLVSALDTYFNEPTPGKRKSVFKALRKVTPENAIVPVNAKMDSLIAVKESSSSIGKKELLDFKRKYVMLLRAVRELDSDAAIEGEIHFFDKSIVFFEKFKRQNDVYTKRIMKENSPFSREVIMAVGSASGGYFFSLLVKDSIKLLEEDVRKDSILSVLLSILLHHKGALTASVNAAGKMQASWRNDHSLKGIALTSTSMWVLAKGLRELGHIDKLRLLIDDNKDYFAKLRSLWIDGEEPVFITYSFKSQWVLVRCLLDKETPVMRDEGLKRLLGIGQEYGHKRYGFSRYKNTVWYSLTEDEQKSLSSFFE